MVDEHLGIEVVELVLHHTGQESIYPLIVGLELLVEPLHTNTCVALHFLVDTGQRQAALLHRLYWRLFVNLNNVGIDEGSAEVLIFRKFVADHIEVDDGQTNVLTNLRCCKANAIGGRERFKHIGNQFGQARIVGSDIFRLLTQYGLAVNING